MIVTSLDSGQSKDRDAAPRLYADLASWWPLLSAPADYAEEAEAFARWIRHAGQGPVREVLELGSGGGNNASHMKQWFQLTLVDRSSGMLDVSRSLNPECEHVVGDMRSIRLERTFDAVFVHDAVTYLTQESELRAAIETAFVHCREGGTALFVPDCIRENFRPSTSHGGHDGDGRGLRYLQWTWDPDPSDSVYVVDYAFLLRNSRGKTMVEQDRHLGGLFSRQQWLRFLEETGFRAQAAPLEHSELEPGEVEVFVATKPKGKEVALS